MSLLNVERDTEVLIDNQLNNLGWHRDPHSALRNVFQQRVKTEEQRHMLQGKIPDYVLYPTNSNTPLAVIEAKRRGRNIYDALIQGVGYAEKLDAPIVFATDGVFTKTIHTKFAKPLMVNGEELDELIREALALKFLATNEISTLGKRVIKSRAELISIFSTVNDLLREEGLQKGLERFTEFANILFLKVLSEIEDIKEQQGEKSSIDPAYRWDYFKNKKGKELLSYVSDTVLKWFAGAYKDENIFQPLQIKHPDNLKQIVDLLDGLQLTDINADIKGDAFEYFIRSYSAHNPTDLGEIFTPRHIVKTMVRLVRPEIGERIFDPFCGTGGMLIVAFKYLMDTMPRNAGNIRTLRRNTVYGSDLTKAASIAKMNMILAGDGHNNVQRRDSLASPIDDEFEIVLTNMPFAQKTRYGDKYAIPSRNGDIICPQNCFRSLKDGGRMAIIVPEGFLSNTNDGAYEAVRKYLLDNATLKSVVSLPRGAFEPYNRAKADILYFTDAKASRTKGHFWFFDVRNDGYTLDKRRRRIAGANDLELILSENNLDHQASDYLMSLGITKIDVNKVKANEYKLSAAYYRDQQSALKYPTIKLGELLEKSGTDKIGVVMDAPIMSCTMEHGLIDQTEKFNKRVASLDISKYRKVYRNELVIGVPIDEGPLGFQTKYDFAAVSPYYAVWKLKRADIEVAFLDLLLRSPMMREVYKSKMDGSPADRRRSIDDDVFLDIEVPIPPPNVRKAIIKQHEEIENATASVKTMEDNLGESFRELWEEDDNKEDKRDIQVAKTRLKQIDADPGMLVSGAALDEELNKLLA
ncbi:MAG: N-6 DNA methylase [Terracidiphilus sp.]